MRELITEISVYTAGPVAFAAMAGAEDAVSAPRSVPALVAAARNSGMSLFMIVSESRKL